MIVIYNLVIELIGKMLIVKLNKFVLEDLVDVFVKFEFFNLGGSVKDWIVLSMIEKVEYDGLLKLGDIIIEFIFGNIGIGLLMVGVVKGYKVIIVMFEMMSIERCLLMKGYGVELILMFGVDGIFGFIREVECLVKENGYFLLL